MRSALPSALSIVAVSVVFAVVSVAEGPLLCRTLCPDRNEREFGTCFAVENTVDPDASTCFSCTASGNETEQCVSRTLTFGGYALFVDSTVQGRTVSPTMALELTAMSVQLGNPDFRVDAEMRIGRTRLRQASVSNAFGLDWSGLVFRADELAAALAADEPNATLRSATPYITLGCLSGLSGGSACSADVRFSYRWLTDYVTEAPPPPRAQPGAAPAEDNRLSIAAIVGIGVACAVVLFAIAGGAGILAFRRKEARRKREAKDAEELRQQYADVHRKAKASEMEARPARPLPRNLAAHQVAMASRGPDLHGSGEDAATASPNGGHTPVEGHTGAPADRDEGFSPIV